MMGRTEWRYGTRRDTFPYNNESSTTPSHHFPSTIQPHQTTSSQSPSSNVEQPLQTPNPRISNLIAIPSTPPPNLPHPTPPIYKSHPPATNCQSIFPCHHSPYHHTHSESKIFLAISVRAHQPVATRHTSRCLE